MKMRLGYPNRIVEVDGATVYVFKDRLLSAPLEEVISYYFKGQGLLPPAIREVAHDIVNALLKSRDSEVAISVVSKSGNEISA